MNIAIISGASSGMGMALTKQLDTLHLDEIWVIARRENRLQQLQKELQTPVRIFALDLSNRDAFTILKSYLEMENPTIKYLINAAGFGVFGRYDVDMEIVSKMINVNAKAVVLMSYLCIPYMHKGSHILQLGSTSSFTPLENFSVYAASKAFVVHFSKALAEEVKPLGIKVTIVCPGWVKTEFFTHANPKTSKYAPRLTRPLYSCDFVVNKVMQDMQKGALMSIPGLFTKMHYALSIILPTSVLMGAWHLMQKKNIQ